MTPHHDKNTPLRMYIALMVLRAWNSGTAGYDGTVVVTINKWIDDGMNGPIPWPDSPFFAEWAKGKGLSNVQGHIGFVFRLRAEPSGKPAAAELE